MTVEYIASIEDEELAGELYEYVLGAIGEQDDDREIIASLPIGLRAAYVLILLDSEIQNGGFLQFFTNWSGRHADEALEFLKMIGAERHAGIVSEAIRQNRELESKYPSYKQRWDVPQPEPSHEEFSRFFSDVETNIEPVFDQLSEAFYELEETASFWARFVSFVRSNPEKCVHRREDGPT